MNFSVETIFTFEKTVKRLQRKYPSLKNDLILLTKTLETDPMQGTPLGNDFYKIRLAISSKGKGKSGGARVITLIKIMKRQVILAAIYDKNEQVSISDKELKILAKLIADRIQ